MPITLITGANQGLGRATAQQLAAQGHTVVIGARRPEAGRQTASELGVESVVIDVTDDESIRAALDEVGRRHGLLDVLINNAAIAGPRLEDGLLDLGDAATVLDTNVAGALRVSQAALPLLRRAARPRVLNVSSSVGSFARATTPGTPEQASRALVYAASKAALNMVTLRLAAAWPDMTVLSVNPELASTTLTDHIDGPPPEEAVGAIVDAATAERLDVSGVFLGRTGQVPW